MLNKSFLDQPNDDIADKGVKGVYNILKIDGKRGEGRGRVSQLLTITNKGRRGPRPSHINLA